MPAQGFCINDLRLQVSYNNRGAPSVLTLINVPEQQEVDRNKKPRLYAGFQGE
jgi:hypothetical protein